MLKKYEKEIIKLRDDVLRIMELTLQKAEFEIDFEEYKNLMNGFNEYRTIADEYLFLLTKLYNTEDFIKFLDERLTSLDGDMTNSVARCTASKVKRTISAIELNTEDINSNFFGEIGK